VKRPRVAGSLVALVLAAASCTSAAPVASSGSPTAFAPTPSSHSPAPTVAGQTPAISVKLLDAPWTRAITRLIGGKNASVSVGLGTTIVFSHHGTKPMLPASNEKLLTSLAALASIGPGFEFPTRVESKGSIAGGVLHGDLWIVGSGDPELNDASMGVLAGVLYSAGLRHVNGSIVGDMAAFDRGWWAPGWLPGISRQYVTRPTALAIDGNFGAGVPEMKAAATLLATLRARGVGVNGSAKTGRAPSGMRRLATIRSAPLGQILARQNYASINFDAEMIAKALGARAGGSGSTASGAAVIQAWVSAQGVVAAVRDGSGLSHQDRISTDALATLLLEARHRSYAQVLYYSLPAPGLGTLSARLAGVPVRAKSGSLFVTPVSALSGYVRDADGHLLVFSILSQDLTGTGGRALEDSIVRVLAAANI
jgi:D-alanyl-D-alanine carboxypeptidase